MEKEVVENPGGRSVSGHPQATRLSSEDGLAVSKEKALLKPTLVTFLIHC